jgi:hypothetical protein
MLLSSCEVRDVTVFRLGAAGRGGEAGAGGLDQAGSGGSAGFTSGSAGTPGSTAGGGAGGSSDSNGGGGNGGGGSGGNGGNGGNGGMVCGSNADCPQGWFCEKASCADPTGSCDLRPSKPKLDYEPVCGCDGVTYWNDVTRREAGMTLLQADQCSTTARPCNDGSDCGFDFYSCARLVSRGEQCVPLSEGACWLLPPDCPDPRSDPEVWQECRPPIQGVPPPPCVDTCRAIRSQHPHQHPLDLKMCP